MPDEDSALYCDEITCPHCCRRTFNSAAYPLTDTKQCGYCGKVFTYKRHTRSYYETRKAAAGESPEPPIYHEGAD